MPLAGTRSSAPESSKRNGAGRREPGTCVLEGDLYLPRGEPADRPTLGAAARNARPEAAGRAWTGGGRHPRTGRLEEPGPAGRRAGRGAGRARRRARRADAQKLHPAGGQRAARRRAARLSRPAADTPAGCRAGPGKVAARSGRARAGVVGLRLRPAPALPQPGLRARPGPLVVRRPGRGRADRSSLGPPSAGLPAREPFAALLL